MCCVVYSHVINVNFIKPKELYSVLSKERHNSKITTGPCNKNIIKIKILPWAVALKSCVMTYGNSSCHISPVRSSQWPIKNWF